MKEVKSDDVNLKAFEVYCCDIYPNHGKAEEIVRQ